MFVNLGINSRKFVICRRDQSKNAPNVIFEEKEDENFASKSEVKVMFYILGITLRTIFHNLCSSRLA